MMRSLFSGVAGLRTHQTRMDVIGNNIANVNTTAYKSQSMVFSDLLYQTTQAASGANAATGRGGVNARQIGLGAKTAAISTAITAQGSAQSTNNGLDLMITGESFFIVNNGQQNFFTRDGSFTVDGAGNLVMASTGYMVMGWQVDETTGEILPDTVSALQVMKTDNLTYPAEATTKAYVSGTLDGFDPALKSTAGRITTLSFYDNRGYQYTAKFSIHSLDQDGEYYVALDDILDEDGVSLAERYGLTDINQIASFGAEDTIKSTSLYGLLESAKYTPGTGNAAGTYSMQYSPGNVLQGYSTNVIILNSKDAEITSPAATDTPGTTAITEATVKGTVTLDKDLLVDELGLIFDKNEKKYYYNSTALENTNADDAWSDALSSIINAGSAGATMTVSNVEVNNATGEVTFSYEGVFQVDSTKTVNSFDGTNFIGGQISDPLEAYGLSNTPGVNYRIVNVSPDGQAQIEKTITYTGNRLSFDVESGKFKSIGGADNESVALSFADSATSLTGDFVDLSFFYDIDIDFSNINNMANGGKTTVEMTSGDGSSGNVGAGRRKGEMIGIEVAQDGKIRASYDNGQTKLVGQIAVANFANAAGLSKEGDNLYSATMNSGDFNGTGDDISATGGKMESGVLEMSNVDLSSEFTTMITTQRGFQANSRIITVSDTLLEELVNLKR